MYEVIYMVNATGEKISKIFKSYHEFHSWWNKARYASGITLLRYPNTMR